MTNYISELSLHAKGYTNKIVITGARALLNILKFGYTPEFIISEENTNVTAELKKINAPEKIINKIKNVKNIKVTQNLLKETFGKISHIKIYSIIKKPELNKEPDKNETVIWLNNPDNLRNIGMSIRSAVSAGIKHIIIDSDQKNPWHPECIQASCGYITYLNSIKITETEEDALDYAFKLKKKLSKKLISMSDDGKEIKSIKEFSNLKGSILIFGNERKGVSPNIKNLSDEIIRIPMLNNISSLNLAHSITLTSYLVNQDIIFNA